MRQSVKALVRFLKREDGPVAVEYAVLMSLLVVVCATAAASLGDRARATLQSAADHVAAGYPGESGAPEDYPIGP